MVGGGVAGMTASLRLAEAGYEVFLVEKEKELVGNVKHSYYTLRGGEPQKFLSDLTKKVESHSLIHLFLGAEVLGCERKERYYQTRIRFPEGEQVIDHGVVILATGGREVRPKGYLYGKDSRVMTQREFERALYVRDERLRNLHSVVMIQCVGSRDEEHPYCSRICCGQAVKNALRLKEWLPEVRIYVLYRDVRTYGFYEAYYHEARSKGVIFIRYDLGNRPKVEVEDGRLWVSVFDPVLRRMLKFSADRLVLSMGVEPNDHRGLAQVFGLELNEDGFFKEANPKSAPLDALERGKFFCGLCHSPNFIEDSISQANAAAARAEVILSRGRREEKPYRAYVIPRLCCGCGLCVDVCPYGARVLNEEGKAEVLDALCEGCGSCVVACRNAASQQQNFEKGLNLVALDTVID